MPRPTTQVQVPVTSTVHITVQLASSVPDDLLDLPTRRALTRSLNTPFSADLDELYAYAHDDQLGPAGERWKGRKPADGNEDEFLTMLVVNDQIGPAMAREVSDQFAKDPEWDAAQGAEKLEEKHEIVTAGTDWHKEAGLTDAAKDAARSRFWAGRMVGRVYIPDEYQDRLIKGSAGYPRTLAEALDLIHVHAVDPREGGPVQDRHGRTLGYWYAYDQEVDGKSEDRRVVEVHTPTQVHRFRLLNGTLEPIDEPADSPFHDPTQPQRARRAEYLMWHADRDGGTAITKTAKHSQDRLTVVVTYHGRNDDQTGYRQLIVTNAEQPKNDKGKPVAFPMGPGVALNIRGLKKPKSGTQGLGSDEPDRHDPTIKVVEPLNPAEYHIPSEDAWKRRILEVFDQAYTLSPEVQVSGESKRVSRKPYDRRVAFAAQDAGAFIAWALRAALMLAAQILGKTAEYRDVTFQPKMFLDVDAVNLEELRVKLQMWESGALTLVSLLEATPGVTDAAKEAGRVEKGKGTGGTPTSEKQAALDRLANGTGGGGAGGSA